MTWYEKASKGYRARFPVPGKTAPGAGPVHATREEAKAWAIQHGHDRPAIDTLAELLAKWRAVKAADGRVMPSYLYEVEERLLDLAKTRKWVRIGDITAAALNQWKVDTGGRGVSRSSSYLLAVLRWGNREYDIPVDPKVLRSRTPRPPRKVMADALLTPKQIEAIRMAAAPKGKPVIALIHYLSVYGPRPVTACTRKVGDVDFRGKTLTVDAKRSGEWRHALLPETLKLFAFIARGRGRDEPLFLDPRTGAGWPVDGKHRAAVLASWYERVVGVPCVGRKLGGIYNLKRYAITSLLRRGMDPMTVARFTGHLSVEQVLLYARSNEASTRAALPMLRPGRSSRRPVGRLHTDHTDLRRGKRG